MATTEELKVVLKTEYDNSGARQAVQGVQELTRAEQIANDFLKQLVREHGNTMRSYNDAVRTIRQSTGVAPTLGPGAFGIAQAAARGAGAAGGGAGGGGGAPHEQLIGTASALLRISGLSISAALAFREFTRYLGDSTDAVRQYQRVVPDSATATTNLDNAFIRAQKSADNLQLAIGRLSAPAAVRGLNLLADAAERIRTELAEGATARARNAAFWENLLKPGGAVVPAWQAAEAQAAAAAALEADRQSAATRNRQNRLRDINQMPVPPTEAERRAIEATAFAQAERRNRRLREINELPGGNAAVPLEAFRAQEMARLAYYDQVDAAVREITDAQKAQTDLQQRSVDLAAEEAQIRLSMLPAQERMAALQRDVAEQQIRARMAALPASEALEDLQYELQRARLIVANRRGTSPEQRSAARREIRELTRAEPGVELAALEAGRPVTLAGRAAERVDLEQQLFQITNERTLAQITEAQETNRLLSQIAAQRTQTIQLTINLSPDQFRNDVYSELIDANAQSQTPPATQSSAVRRSGPS
jgi:hypothetical protein